MITMTILAGILAVATAGVTFLAVEDLPASFLTAFIAFLFFWVIGIVMVTSMPVFTNTTIIAPAERLFAAVSEFVARLFV